MPQLTARVSFANRAPCAIEQLREDSDLGYLENDYQAHSVTVTLGPQPEWPLSIGRQSFDLPHSSPSVFLGEKDKEIKGYHSTACVDLYAYVHICAFIVIFSIYIHIYTTDLNLSSIQKFAALLLFSVLRVGISHKTWDPPIDYNFIIGVFLSRGVQPDQFFFLRDGLTVTQYDVSFQTC